MVRIPHLQPLRILSRSTRQIYRPFLLQLPRTMSSAPSHSGDSATPQEVPARNENEQHEASSQKTPLPLPEPTQAGDVTQLPVGGEGVKLDHLGPLVVNEDGTMSRIANWTEMAEIERQNTLRILGKRNKMRLDKLRAKAQVPEDGGSKLDG
ncbi:hypothetical protein F4677DRAFT_402298 [Hypoxylon crocopeplum]|nr:hypothetical protein F4677DRAFT_402298 [Hypoxylon crocopeplum]